MDNNLDVHIFASREDMGTTAGNDIAEALRERLRSQDRVTVVFAAAPSQSSTLETLIAAPDIEWQRVHAFHMDEYIGLEPGRPELFGQWLSERLFDRLPFGSVHVIPAQGEPEQIAKDYERALGEEPIDIVCCGIGVNGHIAFNDPPVADFEDTADVKVVELDDACRQQQVDDECFPTFDDVPTHAITLTIPRLMNSKRVFCMVPGATKADAVTATFNEEISTTWPSTILRTHPACTFYFDAEAAKGLSS